MTRRFALIDRDGTLIVEKNYLCDPDQVELTPGAGPALRRLRDLGWGIAVVTNQSGVARGYFDLTAVARVHDRLRALLRADGVELDGIYTCPHGPEDDCICRKPLPGLIEQAMADHGFDPRRAAVIGDKAADIDLGKAVGAATILVRTGYGAETEREGACLPDIVADDLPAAVAALAAADRVG